MFVDIVAPATYKGKEVVIYEFAFNRNADYHSITISEGIKTLCDNALNEVSVMKYIKIPSTIVNLGENCMRYMRCETLYIPNFGEVEQGTFSYIGNDASGINTSIHFNGTVNEWINFVRSNYVEDEYNPWYTVKYLGYLYCLDENGVEYLVTEFDLSSYNWTSVDSFFFSNYLGIERVVLPSTITVIDEGAFAQCESLKSINLPEGLVAIYENAFMETKSLESITFPTTLQIIRTSFYASGLKNLVIPGNIKIIEGGTFQNCNNLVSVILEEGVTSIASNAFRSATNLTTVNLPTTLKLIGDSAFYDCAISSIDLSYVETIGEGCLYSNNELREVIISNKCTFIGDQAFYSSETGVTINLIFKGTSEEFESISKGELWNKVGTNSQVIVSYSN